MRVVLGNEKSRIVRFEIRVIVLLLLLLLISFSLFECLSFLFLTFCLFENDMNVNESEEKNEDETKREEI